METQISKTVYCNTLLDQSLANFYFQYYVRSMSFASSRFNLALEFPVFSLSCLRDDVSHRHIPLELSVHSLVGRSEASF